jgi:hypothetical protein
VIVEPDAIAQAKFVSSGRFLAELCDDVTNIILYAKSFITLQILFTAYWPSAESLSQDLQGKAR